MAKALINGKNWFQIINGAQVRLAQVPGEKFWFRGTVNGREYFYTRGKKDAVREFNNLLVNVEEATSNK